VLIVAVSASVLDADREKSRVAGCEAFLPKPVPWEALLETLAMHLALTWQYAEPHGTPDAPLVPPPPAELAALYDFAQSGRLVEIKHAARRIADRDARYRPFADRVQVLARAVDMKGILALIDQFRPQEAQHEPRAGEI
jgi:hypothetical protein